MGSNYRKRGRIIEARGKPDGEPWYETIDGTKWSSYDVEFRPDVAPVEARCMAVEITEIGFLNCRWQGTVADIHGPCPKCGVAGKLAPVGGKE